MRFRSRFSLMLAVASLSGAAMMWAQNPGGSPQGGAPPPSGGMSGGHGAAGPAGPGAGPGAGPMDTPMQTRVNDKKFLKDAAMGSMTETQLGKLSRESLLGQRETVRPETGLRSRESD